MTTLGCSSLLARSLRASSYGICSALQNDSVVRESFLRPSRIFRIGDSIQKNFKWGKKDKGCEKDKGAAKSKKSKKSKKKKEESCGCPPPPPPCPPPEDDGGCDSCPKERTQVCPDTKVIAKCTGMQMPALILGTWKTDEFEVAQKVMKMAFQVGYRAIDTSTYYGNEEVLGCAIPSALSEAKLKREDIFIITKLPFDAMRCDKVNDYLCKSLAALKTPYIDLYMLNFPAGSMKNDKGKYVPDPSVDHSCIWKGMELAVETGKAKYIGVANFSCDQLEDLLRCCTIKPSNIQVEMHAYFQQREFRKVAKELNLTVTAYAPFGRSPGMMEWLKENGNKDTRPSPTENACVQEIAKKHCKTPAQVLLRYLLQLDDNLAVVAGASDPKLICDNFSIFDFNLDEADMFKLKGIDRGKDSRLFDKGVFKLLFPGVEDHPLFPWKDC